jgi:hypothetical protein
VSSAAPLLLAVALGRMDEAFRCLDAALEHRAPEVIGLRSDPRMAALRADPRFEGAVRRIAKAGIRPEKR